MSNTELITQIKTIKESKLKTARTLYIVGSSIIDIHHATGISIPVLRYCAFGPDGTGKQEDCWLRIKTETQGITDYEENRGSIFTQVEAKLLRKVMRASEDLEIEDISELEKITGILEKFYKMNRLEEDKSTENINVSDHGMTLRELMEQKHYSKPIEAEYEEIE